MTTNVDEINSINLVKSVKSVNLITDFYDKAIIFITGGTGFLGKVLIEKLLRSCDGIDTIYILLRSKRGVGVDQRFKDLLKNPVFDRIQMKTPELLKKLRYVGGDLCMHNLGMSEADSAVLSKTVNVVFHVAATVRFNESLRVAATLNALGTKRIMDFCSTFVHLTSVVHVSTAYSNPDKSEVGERVYQPTCAIDPQTLVDCITILPADAVSAMVENIKGKHPNTYTLTKQMAEKVVQSYYHNLPVCIVRPSIVTAALNEPVPGWVDNVDGITGIMMEIGRGMISSIMCDKTLIMDMIPVDIVANTLICSAWHSAKNRSNEMIIYNCTSGQMNPIKWADYGQITLKYARLNPTKYVMMYPNFSYRKNRFIHRIYEIVLHFIPAYIFDIIMRFNGAKPIMAKIARRFKSAAATGEFFAMHEWIFENNNQRSLIKDIDLQEDGDLFNCNVSSMNWDKYVEKYMLGIRKFILKDGIESMPAARRKLQKLLWIKRLFLFGIIAASINTYFL